MFYDSSGSVYKYIYSDRKIIFDDYNRMSKEKEILKYSNPNLVYHKARYLFGNDVIIRLSHRKAKKYMILNPKTSKFVHFGEMGYKDFTKTNDLLKRYRYLQRATNIKGDWKKDRYSANNLAIHLLW
jgi:hypothetical protein